MSDHPSTARGAPGISTARTSRAATSAGTDEEPPVEALRRLHAELRGLSRAEAAGGHARSEPFDEPEAPAGVDGSEQAAGAAPLSGVDLLPELIAYRDRGCHVAPSCLRCPLPACVYDSRPHQGRRRRQARDRRLRALAAHGWSTEQLARHAGLSPSQIRRIRARSR